MKAILVTAFTLKTYIPIPLDGALSALMAIMARLENRDGRRQILGLVRFQYTSNTILLRCSRYYLGDIALL